MKWFVHERLTLHCLKTFVVQLNKKWEFPEESENDLRYGGVAKDTMWQSFLSPESNELMEACEQAFSSRCDLKGKLHANKKILSEVDQVSRTGRKEIEVSIIRFSIFALCFLSIPFISVSKCIANFNCYKQKLIVHFLLTCLDLCMV